MHQQAEHVIGVMEQLFPTACQLYKDGREWIGSVLTHVMEFPHFSTTTFYNPLYHPMAQPPGLDGHEYVSLPAADITHVDIHIERCILDDKWGYRCMWRPCDRQMPYTSLRNARIHVQTIHLLNKLFRCTTWSVHITLYQRH